MSIAAAVDQLEKRLEKSCSADAGAPGSGECNESASRETEERKGKEEGREEEQLLKANANMGDVGQTHGVDRSSGRRTDSVKINTRK